VKRKRKKRTPRERPAVEWRASRTVRRQEELHTPEGVLATLRWAGMFSYAATGETSSAGGQQWHLDRPRILSRDVEVWVAGSEAPLVVYSPNWTSGGKLHFADGRVWHWYPTNFWQTQWAFEDDTERVLVRFEDTSRLLEQSAAVTFVDRGLRDADRALLLVLGRYLMALQSRDTAAAAAATSVTVVT
jgi:hypothetical protein